MTMAASMAPAPVMRHLSVAGQRRCSSPRPHGPKEARAGLPQRDSQWGALARAAGKPLARLGDARNGRQARASHHAHPRLGAWRGRDPARGNGRPDRRRSPANGLPGGQGRRRHGTSNVSSRSAFGVSSTSSRDRRNGPLKCLHRSRLLDRTGDGSPRRTRYYWIAVELGRMGFAAAFALRSYSTSPALSRSLSASISRRLTTTSAASRSAGCSSSQASVLAAAARLVLSLRWLMMSAACFRRY
jgi:hypothetical protein